MQYSFTRSAIAPAKLSCFELRVSAWMMTAALLSSAPGCSTISDAPHRLVSTSAVLPAESLRDNPPADEPQTEIPSLESPPAAITPRPRQTQETSPPPTLPTAAPSTMSQT